MSKNILRTLYRLATAALVAAIALDQPLITKGALVMALIAFVLDLVDLLHERHR